MDGSELSEEHLKDYVSAGAELLDRKRPDWFLHISDLDMGSTTRCVLGQLYGSYDQGRRGLELEAELDEATRHGFTLYNIGDFRDPGRAQLWIDLKNLWLDQIQYRLDHPAEFRIDE